MCLGVKAELISGRAISATKELGVTDGSEVKKKKTNKLAVKSKIQIANLFIKMKVKFEEVQNNEEASQCGGNAIF